MSILQILENIGSDAKRSHKISLIEKHKTNELFMKVVKLALDPYVNFYIRKIPDYDTKGGKTLDWALAELEELSSRKVTGNAGIEHLRNIMSSIDSDDAIVISRIIGKDLRCGMAEATVNSVVEKFIPSYPCLLARPYDEKNSKNIVYPAISQLKADGLRVNLHTDGNVVAICGRSGRAIDLLGAMDADIAKLGKQWDTPVVFDGELVVIDEKGDILPRRIGNGIINKAIKGTISAKEAAMVCAQIWDVIPADEFRAGISKKTYDVRFKEVCENINKIKPLAEDATFSVLSGNRLKYWVIPSKTVSSLEEAEEHFEELLAAGEEGTILKNMCGLWEDSRSKHLVKMKAEKDCDLEIIGWNPGTGQFEGQVGSLVGASSDRMVEVAISGFTIEKRREITDTIDSLIGTIMTVTYNERIKSKARPDVDSLFLPRYQEFRYDKTVANSSIEIK